MTGRTDQTATTSERVIERVRPAAPALRGQRWLTLGLGGLFVVLGVVALLRTGIPADLVLTDGHTQVGWLHHTPLLAVIHLAVGFGLLTTASTPWPAAASAGSATALLLAGTIFLIEPGALHGSLATHVAHGWTYLAAGAAMALSGWLATRTSG